MGKTIKEIENVTKTFLSLSDRRLYSKSEWIFSEVRYIPEKKSKCVLFFPLGTQSTRTWPVL